MYKYILQEAGDINWMAIFALLTFCFIFAVSIIVVFGRSNEYIQKMSSMPLDDSSLLNKLKKSDDENK